MPRTKERGEEVAAALDRLHRFIPLSLYDEVLKPIEAVTGELLAELDALREALKRITPESPWDVDQDCRYCAGHYDRHEANCAWLVARTLRRPE